MRLGYLTSQYPATSHTFIRREVSALRALGIALETYSIRAPADAELVAAEDRLEADRTYTVLRRGPGEFARAHAGTLVQHPVRYLQTLRLALTHRPPGLRALLLALAHFAESVVLASRLRHDGITHLHNHFANSAATVGLLASRLLGLGWSFTMHGISETDYPAGLMLPAKIKAAEMVACVSWFGRAQAMRLVPPHEWDKLRIVRCGLELDRLPPRREPSDRTIRIVCVGRLSPEKGIAGLLQAFAMLGPTAASARLILVGDGPEQFALNAMAQNLGVAEAVTFRGRLPEQATLEEIAQSDILVLPSFMEGLPIVLMEAMALRLPVIASRVAGIPELVQDGVNGLLFTPANWEELAKRLEQLLTDTALRQRLGEEGRRAIEAQFDVRRSARQLSVLFESLQQLPSTAKAAEQ